VRDVAVGPHKGYVLKDRGVTFCQEPTAKPYGIEAVFKDLYGNTYALVEHLA
jgi:hypothetical protein